MSGTECTAAVLDEFPDACIRMLSTHSGEEEIYCALQAGPRGCIVKNIIREEMLCAVHECIKAGSMSIQSWLPTWPSAAYIVR